MDLRLLNSGQQFQGRGVVFDLQFQHLGAGPDSLQGVAAFMS
jgi:hypothetical protein